MPAVSILVPCRNEQAHIQACILGLLALAPPAGGFEIVVADGQSNDGTRHLLDAQTARDSRLVVVSNLGKTTPCGLNAALSHAKGRIIVRADAHTEYAPDYLLRCIETLEATKADNVGGPARTKATGYIQRSIAAAYHSPFAVGGARFHDVNYEGNVDTVTYGCWPRETFEKFGLFDEELVRNQDDEHNLRITRGGGTIHQSPRIRSWYHPRASLGALFQQYRQYGYWKVRVIQKHRLPASPRHLVPGAFLIVNALLLVFSLSTWLGWKPAALAPWALLSLVAAYFSATILASVITARKAGLSLFPLLPAVFACYHFGYGIGFVQGLWDFVILRRGASKWSAAITRPNAQALPKG